MKITAELIEQRLREKHANDIFVSQCKTGGTWFGKYQIFDVWTMKKSWANPLTTGYEIKIDRADFLNDNKWMGYLEFCNEFYFVSPSKLIQPDEVHEDAGLMWISTTGTRIYTKKKAKYRDVDGLESLYKYILMSRTRICDIYETEKVSRVDYWRRWLRKKDEEKELGWTVSKKLRELVEERIDKVESENKILRSRIEHLEDIKEFVEKLGVSISGFWWKDETLRQIKNLKSLISKDVEQRIRALHREFCSFIEILDEAKKGENSES